MKFRLLVKSGTGKWRVVADTPLAGLRAATWPETTVAESDDVRAAFASASDPPPAIRIFVGSVAVASTIPTDRVAAIEYEDSPDAEDVLACRGKFFVDWVGNTELLVKVRIGDADSWQEVFRIPVAVSAGKITGDQFQRLFSELEKESASVLLDIYGKTQVGLKNGGPAAPTAPIATLHRIKDVVQALDGLLRQIDKRPACKLKATRTRELALAGQAVSEATLQEACADSSLLCRVAGRVAVREHLHDRSRADFRIPEHRTIADFAEYLQAQLADLRVRVDAEMRERQGRRSWRNASRGDGRTTWWEQEDLPRIEELGTCRDALGRLQLCVEAWSALSFLPAGSPLRTHPRPTPLFRSHPLYRRAYRVMAAHFIAFRATLDTQPLMAKARSLPVLYEWWCTLRVLRKLFRVLSPAAYEPGNRSPVAMRLAQGRNTLTIEFAADQSMTFEDRHGGTVRFRYTPIYERSDDRATFGLLGGGTKRTPDITVEIYPRDSLSKTIPTLIVVFDAKYTSISHQQKMDEVKAKYSAIGDLSTGTVLSRQIWVLTPVPSDVAHNLPQLQSYATIDNTAFWSDSFVMSAPVAGAIEVRPVSEGAFDPLDALLDLLLRRSGIVLSADSAVGSTGRASAD